MCDCILNDFDISRGVYLRPPVSFTVKLSSSTSLLCHTMSRTMLDNDQILVNLLSCKRLQHSLMCRSIRSMNLPFHHNAQVLKQCYHWRILSFWLGRTFLVNLIPVIKLDISVEFNVRDEFNIYLDFKPYEWEVCSDFIFY